MQMQSAVKYVPRFKYSVHSVKIFGSFEMTSETFHRTLLHCLFFWLNQGIPVQARRSTNAFMIGSTVKFWQMQLVIVFHLISWQALRIGHLLIVLQGKKSKMKWLSTTPGRTMAWFAKQFTPKKKVRCCLAVNLHNKLFRLSVGARGCYVVLKPND